MTLLFGRYQDVLADAEVDCVICDPPYSRRNHAGHDAAKGTDGSRDTRRSIDYGHWEPADVRDFVGFFAPRNRGWFACMTSHDLIPAWEDAYRAAGLYAFAPVPAVIKGMTVRLLGDGPSSWAVYLMVARPRTHKAQRWRTLPGAYVTGRIPPPRGDTKRVVGGKPLSLMLEIVRDYSRPGDLVCDPCAGHATTLVAAKLTGRRYLGAEIDEGRHAIGLARLEGTDAEGETPIEILAKKNGELL